MATWELFKVSAKRAANKAIKETGDAADLAALHIKLKALEAKRNDEYEMLGRLTYRQLKTGVSQAERIAPVIEKLDMIRARIKKVENDIEETKQARSERRARSKMLDAGLEDADEIIEEANALVVTEDDEDDD